LGAKRWVFLLGVGLLCGIVYVLSWTFYPQWLLELTDVLRSLSFPL